MNLSCLLPCSITTIAHGYGNCKVTRHLRLVTDDVKGQVLSADNTLLEITTQQILAEE